MDARDRETALIATNYQFGVDSNQQRTFDRVLARTLEESPDVQITEAAEIALEITQRLVPTAREAAARIAEMRAGPAYCYLAFYGLAESARYLKVGMSSHPEQRFCSAATDNPLDRLWTFIARFPVRTSAFGAERRLLSRLKAHKRRGEWLDVGETGYADARALARQISEVIGAAFQPLEVARGH